MFRCAGTPLLIYFLFCKHLWICNDVYMRFSSNTQHFGLSSYCKHVNKGWAWLMTAAPIEHTWNLTNRKENNLIMHATPSTQCRTWLFKQHCKHLLIKRILLLNLQSTERISCAPKGFCTLPDCSDSLLR